jgi:Purple acid Phosphatase, N-terminal domain
MNRLLLKRATIAVVSTLLCSSSASAQKMDSPSQPSTQIPPPAPQAAHVEILQQPALEFARDDLAIIRWTINNPGGSDDHFAVVHYGTDPNNLSSTAKSHIRLNRNHPETIFRARLDGLKPLTTYYYWVMSTGSNELRDGERSRIERFTTPGPGERVVEFPQPK